MGRTEVGFKGATLVGAVVDTAANPGLGGGKTYVVGANETEYTVPQDATVILFTDLQDDGIVMPATVADNAVVKLVNSSTSGAIGVTGIANLTSIVSGAEVTAYAGDVGGSGNLWVAVETGTVAGA